MDNKKLGLTLLALSLVFGFLLFTFILRLEKSSQDHGCFPSEDCRPIQQSISLSHIAFGVFGFILALSIYLLFFGKGDEAIVKRLEKDSQAALAEEKFSILLKALDPSERKILTLVRNEEGVTQNMLPVRSGLSKAKVSYVITELERRELIRRVQKNKTQAVYLKEKV